jgi:hypothetical protein
VIKVALICDNCRKLIADGISANEVRLQAETFYHTREGNDLCLACEGGMPAVSATTPHLVSR